MKDHNVLLKTWRDRLGCPKSIDGLHWAYYVFQDDTDKMYWLEEHFDEENQCWWRHYDFMSIPCYYCGIYSPLRASTQFSTHDDDNCSKEEVIDYHPDDILPDTLAYYRENGWIYIFFKETLSDSICGQETFTLKHLPDETKRDYNNRSHPQ